MALKTLEDVKALFENRSYAVRSEFINDYDFNDEYFDYYKSFILDANNIKDIFYLSDLIDLSGWLKIYDLTLQNRWLNCLLKPSHYLVKLAVLDYFKFCNKEVASPSYETSLKQLLKRNSSTIVKNQILFNLLIFNLHESELYKDALKLSLSKTKDWRSIYRTLSDLKEIEINHNYRIELLELIKQLHRKNNFGEGVERLLA